MDEDLIIPVHDIARQLEQSEKYEHESTEFG